MKKKTSAASKVILTLTLLFFYLPILYIIVFSFNDSRSLTKFGGFSLRWYEKMFADSTMMEAVLYTVVIAILATVVSTIVGTVTAIGLSKSKKVLQAMVERVNDLPVMNPDIVTGISLLMFFSVLAVKKGFLTLLLAHIMFCIPYVMLSVTPKLRSLDPNLIDAAMDLGATPFQALTRVIVPQIRPGIVSGALIAFTMSFDDFVISYFTTGNGVNNISILVYTMSKRVNPSINALSTLVIVAITLVLGIVNLVPILHEKREKEGSEKGKSFAQSRKLMAAVAGVLVLAILGGTVGVSLSQQHKNAAAVEKYGSNVLKLYLPGEYLGETVQVIPHITNEIKSFIYSVGKKTSADVVITEIGGTTGDIESQPFLEAIRQVAVHQAHGGRQVRRGHSLGLHDRTPDEGELSPAARSQPASKP